MIKVLCLYGRVRTDIRDENNDPVIEGSKEIIFECDNKENAENLVIALEETINVIVAFADYKEEVV